VAINYLRQGRRAEQTAEEIRSFGVQSLAVKANVAEVDDIERMFEQIRDRFGKVNILISNAASGVLRSAMELTPRHWQWTMEINAGTLLPLVQKVVAMMPSPGGKIVAVSSLGATRAIPNYTAVGASKAALESLVRHISLELAPRGININAVSAGVVDTEALRHFPNRDELIGRTASRTPAGRLTEPEDVADAVLFLVSPLSKMIHGQTIVVDGGYSILA
jgi:enoyl-[acyl-carrier protein] reductase III